MNRRSPGEGTVSWDPAKRRATARIAVGVLPSGHPKRVSKVFSLAEHGSEKAAMKAARLWLGQQAALKARGTLIDASRDTLAAWIEDWLASVGHRRAPKTHASYEYVLTRMVLPSIGHVRLRDLSPSVLQRWANSVAAQPMGWRALHYLRIALNQAERLELIARNPARHIRLEKPKNSKPLTRWSPAECSAALTWCAANDRWLYAYVHLGLVTGMRREELLGLRWPALYLDAEHPHIEVREVMTYVRNQAVFGPPKTKKNRTIYLDAGTVQILREHRGVVAVMERRKNYSQQQLVFPAVCGKPIRDGVFMRRWKRMCSGAGVTRIRIYDLRSTYASLSEGKLSETVAAARAGHSVAVRRAHYLRSIDDEQKAAALPLEELIK